MKQYLLTGEDKHVDDVIKNNRIRVERGWIKFTPIPSEESVVEDNDETDTKEVTNEDTKEAEVADVKEEPTADTKKAPASKSKRTKKSE